MTPGLSKDIRCHVWPYFPSTCKWKRPEIQHIKRAVSLVIAYDHHNLPQRFVWVDGLTYLLYRPQGEASVGAFGVMHVRALFLCLQLQITRSCIRLDVKWAVSLVIADGHLIFLRGLCVTHFIEKSVTFYCAPLMHDVTTSSWFNVVSEGEKLSVRWTSW